MKRIMLLIVILSLMTACSNSMDEVLDNYHQDMADIAEKNEQLSILIESFDYTIFTGGNNVESNDSLRAELREMSSTIEEEIIPLADEIEAQLNIVEVTHEDLETIHNTFLESFDVKQNFISDLDRYVELYYQTLTKSEELVRLSQMFIENQEIRKEYIENADTDEEEEEIDRLIDQINENSSELEESANDLQGVSSPQDKQAFIDDTLRPLIENHIRTLNEINLDTDLAIRVRSITLEMYYGYEKYYTERRDTIYYNEELERLQIDSILQQLNVYQDLAVTYRESLSELIDEK